jgi:hypothetical protein
MTISPPPADGRRAASRKPRLPDATSSVAAGKLLPAGAALPALYFTFALCFTFGCPHVPPRTASRPAANAARMMITAPSPVR